MKPEIVSTFVVEAYSKDIPMTRANNGNYGKTYEQLYCTLHPSRLLKKPLGLDDLDGGRWDGRWNLNVYAMDNTYSESEIKKMMKEQGVVPGTQFHLIALSLLPKPLVQKRFWSITVPERDYKRQRAYLTDSELEILHANPLIHFSVGVLGAKKLSVPSKKKPSGLVHWEKIKHMH